MVSVMEPVVFTLLYKSHLAGFREKLGERMNDLTNSRDLAQWTPGTQTRAEGGCGGRNLRSTTGSTTKGKFLLGSKKDVFIRVPCAKSKVPDMTALLV